MRPSRSDIRGAAFRLFAQGITRAETARQLGVSRATATRWFRMWQRGELPTVRPGRPAKLGAAALSEVHSALRASPLSAGMPLDRWSLAAVAVLIQRVTGVAYHRRHIPRVLRRSGWTVLPVGKHAVDAFQTVQQCDPDGNVFLLAHRTTGDRATRP